MNNQRHPTDWKLKCFADNAWDEYNLKKSLTVQTIQSTKKKLVETAIQLTLWAEK